MAGLLSTGAPQAGLLGLLGQPRSPAPPPQPQRARVGPWRVFDRVLGGQTVSEGLDAERARLEAEAMRPQQQAQQQQILQSITDPRERALFMTDPGAWAENVGYQFRPRTLAPGSVERLGGQTVGGAPVVERFDDRFGVFDPMNPQGGARYTDPRGPTFSEETGRINANNPINVAPGGRAVDPQTGQVIAEGAPRVFSAGDGAQLYSEDGRQIAENVRDAPPVDPAKAEAQQRAAAAERQQIASVRSTIERAKDQIGFWTTGPLSGLAVIGGTPAADLNATLDTIEANLSFRALAEMRANSPTGGALGSITERELQLLGATVANLRQSQSPSQLRENLATIERTLTEIESRSAQQASAGGGARPRARNPQTGAIVEWNGTAWVPAQ